MHTIKHKNKACLPAQVGLCIIGGGPAGLMAAIQAARVGVQAAVFEAGQAPCSRLLITGGGRCNLSHAGSPGQILDRLRPKHRFIRHAIYTFPPDWVVKFFGELGLETYKGPNGSIFPQSNRAADVREILVQAAKKAGAMIFTGCRVTQVWKDEQGFIVRTNTAQVIAKTIVLATGGLGPPRIGFDCGGLRIAQGLGHRIIPPRPGLVPLVTAEQWPGQLAGISLQAVRLIARGQSGKFTQVGPLVFTDDGIGGPCALDLSRYLADGLTRPDARIELLMDLAPALDKGSLEQTMVGWARVGGSRQVLTFISTLLPRRLAEVVLQKAGCSMTLLASQLDRKTRDRILELIKAMPLTIIGTRPMDQAMIMIGGVDTEQIDPRTMGSRICPGLFLAGEIIDVDGPCGGYNLQICWSTGALAGRIAALLVANQGR